MKNILTIYDQDIFLEAPVVDTSDFRIRRAVRAIVSDNSGKVALLHVGLYGYYKLPGGGIEEGEDISVALKRELLEEIGCEVEVAAEVGKVIEYRSHSKLEQISYCFFATQIGKKGKPYFTEEEL